MSLKLLLIQVFAINQSDLTFSFNRMRQQGAGLNYNIISNDKNQKNRCRYISMSNRSHRLYWVEGEVGTLRVSFSTTWRSDRCSAARVDVGLKNRITHRLSCLNQIHIITCKWGEAADVTKAGHQLTAVEKGRVMPTFTVTWAAFMWPLTWWQA